MMGISLLLAGLIIFFTYSNPLKGLENFFLKPFTNKLYLGNLLNRTTLYVLSGGAIVLAFKGGEFNLGGEGQICLGGMVTTAFLLTFPRLPGTMGIFLAMLLAATASGLLGAFSAVIKNRYQISEVISTYLLSMGVIQVSRYLISGPMKDKESYLITTPMLEEKFFFTDLMEPSHFDSSVFLVPLVIVGIYIFLYHHHRGYEWRLCGKNRQFATYCGINVENYRVRILFTSGFLNGIAGAVAILGTHHRGLQDFFSGVGWNGMAVSLIGGNHPLFLLPSALFFSHLVQGSELLTLLGRFSFPLDGIIMAIVILLVTSGRLKRD